MINISNYMPSESGYALRVDIGLWFSVWFSYGVPVAFCTPGCRPVVSENVWTRSTGKHIAHIAKGWSGGVVPHAEFEAQYAAAMWRLRTVLEHMDDIELMRRLENAAKEETGK